jgi:hypothetical protein
VSTGKNGENEHFQQIAVILTMVEISMTVYSIARPCWSLLRQAILPTCQAIFPPARRFSQASKIGYT